MRVKNGTIYLNEPLFGRQILTGACLVMNSWVDYTFSEGLTSAELGLPEDQAPPAYVRLLIPLSQVRAVIVEREESPLFELTRTEILQEV